MRWVVDSNVWIDLLAAGLLEPGLLDDCGAEVMVPDVFAVDVEPQLVERVLSLGVAQAGLPPRQVMRVEQLAQSFAPGKRPGMVDLFALVVAEDTKSILLTGDGNLRAAAWREGVEVHGTLWLLEHLVTAGRLPPARAADALEAMLEFGRRLPEHECRQRMARWRGMT